MPIRRVTPTAILLAALFLMLCACEGGSPAPTPTLESPPTASPTPAVAPATSTPAPTPTTVPTPTPSPPLTPTLSPYTGYLAEEIPPCAPAPGSSIDPCEPHPVTMLVPKTWWLLTGLRIAFDVNLSKGVGESFRELRGTPPGVEEQLGAFDPENFDNFVTHIVARATFLPGTERCTRDDPFRPASYDEALAALMPVLATVQCFADVRVNEYILGRGAPRLTVQTALYLYPQPIHERILEISENEEEREAVSPEGSAELYRHLWEYAIPHGDEQPNYETGTGFTLTGGIRGKEVVLFLGPSINNATEAWQIFETWDVWNLGTAVAIHPFTEAWESSWEYSQEVHGPSLIVELPRFRQDVAEAGQARLEAFGGRIGADETLPMLVSDTNDLGEFMIGVGPYGP